MSSAHSKKQKGARSLGVGRLTECFGLLLTTQRQPAHSIIPLKGITGSWTYAEPMDQH